MADITGSSGNDTLNGTNDDDVILGLEGDDILFGEDGNDQLNGGEGVDHMAGGAGNDVYGLDEQGDSISEAIGEGFDIAYAFVSYRLAAAVALELLSAADHALTIPLELTGNELANLIWGNAGVNVLTGKAGNDELIGFGGDDQLNGDAGNDYLEGGSGADTMAGGSGDDLYSVDNAADLINESSGNGTNDRVYTSVSYALGAGAEIEILSAADNASTAALDLTGSSSSNKIWATNGANALDGGSGNDDLIGFAGDDTLTGGLGDDYLDGGTGADDMAGGSGSDYYVVDDAGDRITEGSGASNDRAFTTVSFALGVATQVELLAVADGSSTGAIDLTGSDTNNKLWGNNGANTLTGNAGNDELIGFAGDDVLSGGLNDDYLEGGAGVDQMSGGLGNDIYLVENALDVVSELAGQGDDRVLALANYTLAAGTSIETLSAAAGVSGIALTGNELVNAVNGSTGADTLDGGAGADTLSGLTGNDTYYVDDPDDIVLDSGGTDAILARANYTSTATTVETLATADRFGTGFIDLTIGAGSSSVGRYTLQGNDGFNVLTNLSGRSATIEGFGGNDRLIGGTVSDTLDGGLGADRATGGGGFDIFAFTTALGGGNVDILTDVLAGTDDIALDDAIFTGLAPGALPASAFVAGTAAADADDRIVYDQASGQLWFDADGSGAGAQVLFATLSNNAALTASDFVVI